MSLLDNISLQQSFPLCNYGTGTLYDLVTGKYRGGSNDRWILNGGIVNMIQGIQGKGNMFKSTIAAGLVVNSMAHYPGSEAIVVDTENSLIRDLERVANFAPHANTKDIVSRITPLSGIQYDIGEFHKFMVELCVAKEKHKKDYIIESPFINPLTMKPEKAWVPTYVVLDSITEMRSSSETKFLNDKGIDDEKARVLAMNDGLKKTILLSSLRKMCETHGICVFVTAATGKVNDMSSRTPQPKYLQHSRSGEKPKRVGANFETLTGTLSQAMSASFMSMDSKGEVPRYPHGKTPGKDVNEVSLVIQRGKTMLSGGSVPFVVSQEHGILNSVTNFNYCKTNGYFGMAEKSHNCKLHLSPKQNITRTNVRELMGASYELRRALEITAELCFIQQTWSPSAGSPLTIHPEKLFDRLTKSSTKMEDLLNTTGVWTYDKKADRKYMSTLDIVELVEDKK